MKDTTNIQSQILSPLLSEHEALHYIAQKSRLYLSLGDLQYGILGSLSQLINHLPAACVFALHHSADPEAHRYSLPRASVPPAKGESFFN